MENEKRKVGDYTILCAVNIGSREIILAENEQSANGERFLCCYGERNDIFEKFTECAVGDDYIDAAMFFAERIKQDAERFREEVEKLDIPVTVITQADCIPDHCALPGFVDSKNEEKTERNAGYLVVSHSGGGMLRQGTRKGIRRTPANRGMRAHRIVKSLDISEDVCHGLCP